MTPPPDNSNSHNVSIREKRILWVVTSLIIAIIFGASDKNWVYIQSDAEGYHMYLPALTLYGGFSDLPVRTTIQYERIPETGNYYFKYTSGVAIMQLPFHGLAHVYTAIDSKHERNGTSPPFQWSIIFAALCYVFCGMSLLYLFLREHYSILISAVTVLSLFVGTNLLYYTIYEPGMSHAYCFFLWVLVLRLSRKIYRMPSWGNFLALSLVVGLLVFIRPTNALAALAILFWDMESLRQRIAFVGKHFLKYASLLGFFAVFAVIQVELWRHMAGEYVLFSYNSEPGFIYLGAPKILNVLFHVHNGLFIYAPILVLPVIGLILGMFKRQKNFVLIASILAIATYLFGSWWSWWFGGAYGHRCYIDFIPLFAIAMAFLLSFLYKQKYYWLLGLAGVIIFITVYYSAGMTSLYRPPWDGPDFGWPEYWKLFRRVWPF